MMKLINKYIFNINNITKIRLENRQVAIFTNDQDVVRLDLEKEPHQDLLYNLGIYLEDEGIEGFMLNELNDFLYEEEND